MLTVVRAAVVLLVLYLVVVLEIGAAVAWAAVLVLASLAGDRLARSARRPETP